MCHLYHRSSILKKEGFFMRKNYNSVYEKHIEEFIEMKHALGYKFITQQCILGQLNDFAVHQKEKFTAIRKEFAAQMGQKKIE